MPAVRSYPRKTNIILRVDQDLKRDADSVLKQNGMGLSQAIRVFLHAVIRDHGIPFEIRTSSSTDSTAPEFTKHSGAKTLRPLRTSRPTSRRIGKRS